MKFYAKLKKVRGALSSWSKDTFRNIFQRIATLEDEMNVKKIQLEMNPTVENKEELHRVNAELRKFLHLEEELWKKNK